jgi:hypothetical protein
MTMARACQVGLPNTCPTRIHPVTREMALRTYVKIEEIFNIKMRRQYISLNSLRKLMKVTLILRI